MPCLQTPEIDFAAYHLRVCPQVADWRDMPRLKLLNLVYDVTPMKYITMVVTEAGVVPPTSVPVIIREDAARMALQAQEVV